MGLRIKIHHMNFFAFSLMVTENRVISPHPPQTPSALAAPIASPPSPAHPQFSLPKPPPPHHPARLHTNPTTLHTQWLPTSTSWARRSARTSYVLPRAPPRNRSITDPRTACDGHPRHDRARRYPLHGRREEGRHQHPPYQGQLWR